MPTRMEHAAARGMGMFKEAKAVLMGLNGVFRTLCEQHGEVTALLLRLKTTSDPVHRRDLWATVRQELLSHERGELEVIYPVLRRYDETRKVAEEHEANANELSMIVAQIDAVDPASKTWKPLFDTLVKRVHDHVAKEEREYFPKAQKALGEALAHDLEARFLAAKRRFMTTLS